MNFRNPNLIFCVDITLPYSDSNFISSQSNYLDFETRFIVQVDCCGVCILKYNNISPHVKREYILKEFEKHLDKTRTLNYLKS